MFLGAVIGNNTGKTAYRRRNGNIARRLDEMRCVEDVGDQGGEGSGNSLGNAESLGEAEGKAAWAEGSALNIESAIEYSLQKS